MRWRRVRRNGDRVDRRTAASPKEDLVDLLGGVCILTEHRGCQTAKDAVLTADLRRGSRYEWVKLEVIGDRELLYPDVEEYCGRQKNSSARAS